MNVEETLQRYDPTDYAILSHGFHPYMRDYGMMAEGTWGPEGPGAYEYLFTHCALASTTWSLDDSILSSSWSDELIDRDRWRRAGSPHAFVWGVCWTYAYPGLTYRKNSDLAKDWSQRLERDMHEVLIETSVFKLRLVFHDCHVTKKTSDLSVIDKVSHPISRE